MSMNSVDKSIDLGDMSYLKKDIDFTTEDGLNDFYKLNEDYLLYCKRELVFSEMNQYFTKHVCACMNEADVVSAWEKYKEVNNIVIEEEAYE